jgi:hypothetical protein
MEGSTPLACNGDGPAPPRTAFWDAAGEPFRVSSKLSLASVRERSSPSPPSRIVACLRAADKQVDDVDSRGLV